MSSRAMDAVRQVGCSPRGLALGRIASLLTLWAGFFCTLFAASRLIALTTREADLGWGVSNSYWFYLDHAIGAVSVAAFLVGCLAVGVTGAGLLSLIRSRRGEEIAEWPDLLVSAANLLGIVLISWSAWNSTYWAFPMFGYALTSAGTLSQYAAIAILLVGAGLTIPGLFGQPDA